MPSTKVLVAIAKILKEEGYIARLSSDREAAAESARDRAALRRRQASRRSARSSGSASRVCASTRARTRSPACESGLGIAIVSTPQGVLTGYEARRRGIGGEVLCTVF